MSTQIVILLIALPALALVWRYLEMRQVKNQEFIALAEQVKGFSDFLRDRVAVQEKAITNVLNTLQDTERETRRQQAMNTVANISPRTRLPIR